MTGAGEGDRARGERGKTSLRKFFRKYPHVCPYCRLSPHRDAECKTVRGTAGSVNHQALRASCDANRARMPGALNEWQAMFAAVYPRTVEDRGRSTVGLMEELGELAEAIRVYDRYPKFFRRGGCRRLLVSDGNCKRALFARRARERSSV